MKLLDKGHYNKAAILLKEVSFNHLFARAVVEQKIDGLIYTDNTESPTSFYILHPYGMSLLTGNYKNGEFNNQLVEYLLNKDRLRNRIDWIQVYPEGWSDQLSTLLGNQLLTKKQKDEGGFPETELIKAEEHTRVNFKFNLNKYIEYRTSYPVEHYEIFRTGEEEFQNMPGTVVPKFFWRSASQFLNEGIGFSLRFNGELASTAFSAFIDNHQLELGIESSPQFRGKGFAMYTCAALIDYCIVNKYEPVWSCRLENTGSYLLAQKLGFEPIYFHPFYKVNI
ncbi:MAG: GNAT family N-acetyltransferase [Bacteroidia bacterium]|nr:GNAT family N-acetyltransferase [Bacteroidia bacterium]